MYWRILSRGVMCSSIMFLKYYSDCPSVTGHQGYKSQSMSTNNEDSITVR